MRAIALGILLLLTLGGCQTTGNPKMFNLSEAEAMKRLPQQCAYRASLSPDTIFVERPMGDAWKGYQAAQVLGSSSGNTYLLQCICKDTFQPNAFNRQTADNLITALMGDIAKSSNHRYHLESNPRNVEWDIESSGLMGTEYGAAKAVASDKCLETFMISNQTRNDPVHKAFLQSIRPASGPLVTRPAATAPKTDTAEDRLTSLKNLYDRSLITKDEYDKKRKAIVDEM
jgi:hypothetical protein